MIKREKDEIEDKVREIWGDEYQSPENIEVTVWDDRVDIELSSMYEAPGLNFAKLSALAEFFGTDNINDDNRFNSSGCETCDYGSSYGFTLTVRPDEKD